MGNALLNVNKKKRIGKKREGEIETETKNT